MRQKFSLKKTSEQKNIVDYSRAQVGVELDGLKLNDGFRRVADASNIYARAPMVSSQPTKVVFDVHGARYTVTVRVHQQLVHKEKGFSSPRNPNPLEDATPWNKVTYPDYYKIDCTGFYNSTHEGTMYVRTRIVHVFEWVLGGNHLAPIVCLELSLRTGSTLAAWTTASFSKDQWDKTIKYIQVPSDMARTPIKVTDGINPNSP